MQQIENKPVPHIRRSALAFAATPAA